MQEYKEDRNAMIAPGMTFVKANQIEHIMVYKSLVMYRMRFGITGNVFFKKPLKIVRLAKAGIRTRDQAVNYLNDLKSDYAEKGFKQTKKLQKFNPTKRAYYLLTKKPYMKRENEKAKLEKQGIVYKEGMPKLRTSKPICKYVGGHRLRPVGLAA